MVNPQPQPAALPAIEHLGLLAGEGDFPMLVAKAARSRGVRVTAFGLHDITSPELASQVDSMNWVEIGRFEDLFRGLHEHGVNKIIMAGRVKHTSIFQLFKLDKRGLKIVASLPNWKADTILGRITREFEAEGIEVLDSTLFLRDCMAASSLLTPACRPSEGTLRDIDFAIEHARGIAALDIGQSIAVKQLSVVAVEAMEGTDAMIERAGEIAGPGVVVAKVGKPKQDARFDVPIVGLTTIKKLVAAQAAALAFPGGEVLFFDQPEAIALAEKNNLTILGV